MGKTAFALNIGMPTSAAGGERTVGMFSLEMSKEQLFLRMLTSAAQIDSHRFRTGLLTEADYGRLSDAMSSLVGRCGCTSTTPPSLGVLEMRAKSRLG